MAGNEKKVKTDKINRLSECSRAFSITLDRHEIQACRVLLREEFASPVHWQDPTYYTPREANLTTTKTLQL